MQRGFVAYHQYHWHSWVIEGNEVCSDSMKQLPCQIWKHGQNLWLIVQAYASLTRIRPCGPKKDAIRAATYDLVADHDFQLFHNLPVDSFASLSAEQRSALQYRIKFWEWYERRNRSCQFFELLFVPKGSDSLDMAFEAFASFADVLLRLVGMFGEESAMCAV